MNTKPIRTNQRKPRRKTKEREDKKWKEIQGQGKRKPITIITITNTEKPTQE
jgi:hypothetical protein